MKYKVRLNDKLYEVEVDQGEAIMLAVSDAAASPVAPPPPAAPAAVPAVQSAAPVSVGDGEQIFSPLPGNIMDIKAALGQSVKKGQVLVLIEAMKMENEVLAPRDGIVKSIITSKGATVETGSPLLTLS